MDKPYTILVLADMHVGNKLAIKHPQTRGYSGFHNEAQEYLWECWQHMLKTIPKKLDELVLMDEIVDGPVKPNLKYQTLITTPRGQRRAAVKLLEPIANRANRIWCLIGTAWHVEEWGQATKTLAEDLGATIWPTGDSAGHNAFIQYEDIMLDFAHHSSTVMVNRTMPLEREMRYRLIDNPLPEKVKAQIETWGIFRAHTHVFEHTEDRHGHGFGCPSWQMPYYQYGIAKRAMARIWPDLGWILLKLRPGTERPIEYHVEIYEMPKVDVFDGIKGEWVEKA